MKSQTPSIVRARKYTWRDLVAIVVLCVLSLVLYRQIALTNQILSGADAMMYFYPYRAHAARSIQSGQIPLWNPYLFLGVPFLANPQTAVLYPPNLALFGLTAPKQVAWSLVIHSALASVFAYLYARHTLSLSPVAACLAAAAFGQGGYLAAQAGHVNQVNVLAWFPLLLLLWETRARARWPSLLGLAFVVGLGLLAGHTQASYISLAGLALYALTTYRLRPAAGTQRALFAWARSVLNVVWQLALVVLVAFGLAAVQILPTLELSRLSIRGGGLDFRQVVAFSLRPLPRLLRYTFLPVWGQGPDLGVLFGGEYYTEYLAYVGYLPLLFALFACVRCARNLFVLYLGVGCSPGFLDRLRATFSSSEWLHESKSALPFVILGGTGLFLALGLYNPFYWLLYKLMPGFGLFRVPARWLFLYAFAAAMLAGGGLQIIQDWLRSTASRWAAAALPALLVLLGIVELLLAAQQLPINHPTPPESFSSLRTAPAHILAAQAQDVAPGRFLSLSDTLYDPGDLPEIDQIYQSQLSSQGLYDHIVNVKRQEILAPNLPLAWRIYAVDGYDGGVLPLARYIHLQRLLLDESDILTDGRLREGLARIPDSRILSILGAEYVITDKVHDVWIHDVFYDLAFETTLTANKEHKPGSVHKVFASASPHQTATRLSIVSHLQNAQAVDQGAVVAVVILTIRNNGEPEQLSFDLQAGRDTAQGLYTQAAHMQARIGREWRAESGDPVQTGYDYVTELSWQTPQNVVQVEIEALPFEGELCIRGLALIDERDQSSEPLLLTARGRFEQVHSGDVKVYRALDTVPRAYAVHQAYILQDDAQAIEMMAAPSFDPSQLVLLHKNAQSKEPISIPATNTPAAESRVDILSYEPHEITLQADMKQPGYIVLSDTWYPGWQASLDGQPVPIERANLTFRAIYASQGSHNLRLVYQPASYIWGLRVTLGTLFLLTLGLVVSARNAVRRAKSAKQTHSD